MCVNRCICTNLTFRELIDRSQRESLDVEGLRVHTGAGGDCTMCAPYIRAALRTGRVSFPVLSESELDALTDSQAPDRRSE